MSEDQAPGRIEVICGCMFAGKTTILIERLAAAAEAGLRVLAFNHATDQRYATAALATHDRRCYPACAITTADEVLTRCGDAQVIGLDEAHFFGRDVARVAGELRRRGRRVIVAGLDIDMWGQPMPPFPQLEALADETDTRTLPCSECGAPARYSQRVTPIVDGNIVGGPEAYRVRCRECFEPYAGMPAPVYDDD